MKVKVISRSTDEFTRERSQDLQKVFRNYDPNLRSQERAVEYTRALNAAKLEKIFARPFVGAMDGHIDAVSCMAKNPNHLKGIFSGSMDGDIRLWDLANRRTVCQFPGHQGAVRGLTVSTDGEILVSCGTDCTVRLWNVPDYRNKSPSDSAGIAVVPIAVYVWRHAFWGVDHQWGGNLFATVGAQVDIWDHARSEPVNTFKWGNDTVISVRFNPGEPDLFATTSSDRSIILYDLRMSSPARKLIMKVFPCRAYQVLYGGRTKSAALCSFAEAHSRGMKHQADVAQPELSQSTTTENNSKTECGSANKPKIISFSPLEGAAISRRASALAQESLKLKRSELSQRITFALIPALLLLSKNSLTTSLLILSVYWQIYGFFKEIFLDYVHHEVTQKWVLIYFQLLLLVLAKDTILYFNLV